MRNVRKAVLAISLAVAFLGAGARSGAADDKKADKGNDFVTMAASAGMAEVKLGQLAAEHASSDDVKKFGQHMVDDHTKANKELMSIVEKKNITVSKELDKKHQAAMDELSKLRGRSSTALTWRRWSRITRRRSSCSRGRPRRARTPK